MKVDPYKQKKKDSRFVKKYYGEKQFQELRREGYFKTLYDL